MATEEDSSARPSSHTLFRPHGRQQRWSDREILHLIDAYQEKWFQLKRGQLKVRHWEEVANSVFLRCDSTAPSKSSVQCKHKIEKLRKKYREEKKFEEQRWPGASLWVYFERLDSMESGLAVCSKNGHGEGSHGTRNGHPRSTSLDRYAQDRESTMSLNDDAQDTRPPPTLHHDELTKGSFFDAAHDSTSRKLYPTSQKDDGLQNLEDRKSPSAIGRPSFKRRMMLADTPIAELASVVRSLGEGFLKIEQLKLEMQRDNERLRAEMELKRTGMLLDSQKQIAEMLSRALGRKKGVKKRQIQETY